MTALPPRQLFWMDDSPDRNRLTPEADAEARRNIMARLNATKRPVYADKDQALKAAFAEIDAAMGRGLNSKTKDAA